jgi:hypothetical protein
MNEIEGTGAMISQLKEGKLDVIVALTEGLVAGTCRHSLCSITANHWKYSTE